MKKIYSFLLCMVAAWGVGAQSSRLAVIGSSTAAGVGASVPDSSWVGRLDAYYRYQLGTVDTIHRLGVSGTTSYRGMPTSYTPPGGRPAPDPAHNVTRAVHLLQGLSSPANGVVIVNYPSNGYDVYTIPEIMGNLQTIYDSVVRTGNRCYVTTTQPRSDGNFSLPSVRLKMAVLKDSIINRFGTANTLNFWDGMYNPADTTILPAYRADSTHFNNLGHRVLFDRVVAKNIFNLAAPAAGDYRSNVAPTGLWSSASSWETWNGTAWVAAATPPTSASGTVTVVNGDSIRVNTAVTVDQVVVEGGAALAFFNTTTPTTFTLNDDAGDDIVNNGRLYVSFGATLAGAGTIRNSSVGTMVLRNTGILQASTVNSGFMQINSTGTVQNATLTNNKTCVLVDFTLNLNSATFINNDSFAAPYNSTSYLAGTGGTFTNTATGVIFKPATAGVLRANPGVVFNNSGRIKGFGEYQLTNTGVNNGQIVPGNSPGQMTVNPALITGKTPVFNLELFTGGTAGTGYDQLVLSTVDFSSTNVSGVTLNVIDRSADPAGTTYTLVTSTGTITGPFAAVNLPPSLGNLTYTANGITVQRVTALPLTWGGLRAQETDGSVQLQWSTYNERNVARFVAEHSLDGRTFADLGAVPANGTAGSAAQEYSFLHPHPAGGQQHYYRVRIEEADGARSYSEIRSVFLNKEKDAPAIRIMPNPAGNVLEVISARAGISMVLTDLTGRRLRSVTLASGSQQLDLQRIPAGIYLITAWENARCVSEIRLVKQ